MQSMTMVKSYVEFNANKRKEAEKMELTPENIVQINE